MVNIVIWMILFSTYEERSLKAHGQTDTQRLTVGQRQTCPLSSQWWWTFLTWLQNLSTASEERRAFRTDCRRLQEAAGKNNTARRKRAGRLLSLSLSVVVFVSAAGCHSWVIKPHEKRGAFLDPHPPTPLSYGVFWGQDHKTMTIFRQANDKAGQWWCWRASITL